MDVEVLPLDEVTAAGADAIIPVIDNGLDFILLSPSNQIRQWYVKLGL